MWKKELVAWSDGGLFWRKSSANGILFWILSLFRCTAKRTVMVKVTWRGINTRNDIILKGQKLMKLCTNACSHSKVIRHTECPRALILAFWTLGWFISSILSQILPALIEVYQRCCFHLLTVSEDFPERFCLVTLPTSKLKKLCLEKNHDGKLSSDKILSELCKDFTT